jgi:RimJ/RimL family protein N-acetyltransferase
MAHAGFPLGLNTTAEEIAESISSDSDETRRRLIIEYKGLAIGETSYGNVGDRTAQIGIKICEPDYQEKGLGRVILSLLIRRLFENGFEKIVLDTNTKNSRAQHVYELLGFRKVRINENAWTDQLGEPQSSIDYELLRDGFHDFSDPEREVFPLKLLILGNSITHHSPAPDIGWTGDWGMAASAREKDFVHQLAAMLEAGGTPVVLRERNVAEFERDPNQDLSVFFAGDLAFRPNAVVLRICENTPAERLDDFAAAYEKLILLFRLDPACTVFAVGPFWKNDRAEALLSEAAFRTGARWISLSPLHSEEYQAIGQFAHAGVAGHPSDKGMKAIAEAVFAGFREAGLLGGA